MSPRSLRHPLLRVLGGEVAQLGHVRVAVERVVVDRDLGVERHHLAALRDQQRVHLHQRGVLAHEDVVELGEHRADRPDHVGGDAGLEGQPAPVEVLEAEQRVHVQHPHRLGVLLGDLLHVHAAHSREHGHRLLRGAVEDDRRVVLLVDLEAFSTYSSWTV